MRLIITGVKELDDVFKKMPLELTDRVLQQAHTAALKPLVTREKLTAPEGPTGNLIDSIGVVKASARSIGSRDLGAVAAGPRRKGGHKGHAGHLVEFGTRSRQTKGKGKFPAGINRGVMPAKPFALPAWRATQDTVLQSVNNNIAQKLVAFMRRTLKG